MLPLFISTAASATCPSLTITFADASLNAPAGAARQWSFPGGTPARSTAARPVVTYVTPGIYPVVLTATNAAGSDSAHPVHPSEAHHDCAHCHRTLRH